MDETTLTDDEITTEPDTSVLGEVGDADADDQDSDADDTNADQDADADDPS